MGVTYSKSFVEAVIASNGQVADRPSVVKIVEFYNVKGHRRWGVVYVDDKNHDRYEAPSKLRRNAKVIYVNKNYAGQQIALDDESVELADDTQPKYATADSDARG